MRGFGKFIGFTVVTAGDVIFVDSVIHFVIFRTYSAMRRIRAIVSHMAKRQAFIAMSDSDMVLECTG